MKRRICAGILVCCMMLGTGCAALLSRNHAAVTPHSATPEAEGDPSTLRVENYQELVNAVLYLVTQRAESGKIRLYNYTQAKAEEDLTNACLEVEREDPLGAYSVDFIKQLPLSAIVSYYEAELQISYRRTAEQVASIVSATGSSAIRAELRGALAEFPSEVVLRIGYLDRDEDYIQTLIEEAYYAAPASALDFPDCQVYLYPEQGTQRIVEILLTYHEDVEALKSRQSELTRRAEELLIAFLPSDNRSEMLLWLAELVLDQGSYSAEGGATVYDVLLGGSGNSQALALTMTLFCQMQEINCTVVSGTRNGERCFWNVVETQSGYRHLDLTRMEGDTPFFSDRQAAELGYEWTSESVPQCGEQPG